MPDYQLLSKYLLLLLINLLLAAVHAEEVRQAPTPQPASAHTRAFQQEQIDWLPMADNQAFTDADRGFIAALGETQVRAADGRVVWSLAGYQFLQSSQVPDSVHPALWRHARLNSKNGLYKVTERLYQLRGFDISNMTIIEWDSGLIVIDPLVSQEVAKEALEFYYRHRPRKPIRAVIYSPRINLCY